MGVALSWIAQMSFVSYLALADSAPLALVGLIVAGVLALLVVSTLLVTARRRSRAGRAAPASVEKPAAKAGGSGWGAPAAPPRTIGAPPPAPAAAPPRPPAAPPAWAEPGAPPPPPPAPSPWGPYPASTPPGDPGALPSAAPPGWGGYPAYGQPPGGGGDQSQPQAQPAQQPEAEEWVSRGAPPAPPAPVAPPAREEERAPAGAAGAPEFLPLGGAVPAGAPAPTPAPTTEADERVRGIVISDRTRDQAPPAPMSVPPAPAAEEREHLSFTAYYPREAPAESWQTLLVYTHVDTVLAAVRADAARFAPELGERPRTASAPAEVRVQRGTALTIVPRCAGVRFNPERVSFSWDEDLHRADFRFRPQAELAGTAASGEITIFAGPLIVAILKFGLLVDERAADEHAFSTTRPAVEQETALPRAVFASYSHDDTRVVTACRNAYQALGLTVNIDIDSLRSGDYWGSRLMELIDGSDLFQLFWSAHAARSAAVAEEWRYALARSQRHGPGFIRPVYWEQPLVPPPPELADLHFAYIELPALDAPAR